MALNTDAAGPAPAPGVSAAGKATSGALSVAFDSYVTL